MADAPKENKDAGKELTLDKVTEAVKATVAAETKALHDKIAALDVMVKEHINKPGLLRSIFGGGKPKAPEATPAPKHVVRTNSSEAAAHQASDVGLVPAVSAGVEKTALAASTVTAAGVAGAGLEAAGVAPNLYSLPILNKIPYLPQISASIYGGLNTVASYFGINTGAAATNATLAALPTPTAPLLLGGLGLGALGKLNEKITGRPTPSGKNPLKMMWNGIRSVYDFPAATLNKAGEYTKKTAGWVWDYGIKAPGRIARDYVWNPLLKPMVKPTLWGVGGGFLGAAAAASVAGTPLTPAIALGFFGMNYLKNKGYLANKSAEASK